MILTFDDGPDAANTPKILDALKAECVRATFFEIGRNAEALPGLARREVLEGHTVAFHTWSHPQPTLRFMAASRGAGRHSQGHDRGREGGLRARRRRAPSRGTSSPSAVLPLPRLRRHARAAPWLAANDVGVFGVDLWASDWIRMTPEEELKLVMSRLEKNGHRGMLLMHDNHPWTAAMVPVLLQRLKAEGYRIVHMTGGGAGSGPTARAARLDVGDRAHRRRARSRGSKGGGQSRVADGPIPVKPAPTE